MSRVAACGLRRAGFTLLSRTRQPEVPCQTPRCGTISPIRPGRYQPFSSSRRSARDGIAKPDLDAPKEYGRKVEEADGRLHPPSAPRGNVSIVFTDIVRSTALWEKDTPAMVRAMQIHDAVLRRLCLCHQGYEVKQNGDGFMIAFPAAGSAIQFCLDVQEQLLDESWPKGILRLEPGQEATDDQGHVLFRGLKLRMSAHWGVPVCKWNEIINRMDYLGPVVNRAARYIEVTEGGQIVVSEDFLVELQVELERAKHQRNHEPDPATYPCQKSAAGMKGKYLDLAVLRSPSEQEDFTHHQFEVRLLGDAHFKGLEEEERLFFIVPRSLKGRADYWYQTRRVEGVKGNIMANGD